MNTTHKMLRTFRKCVLAPACAPLLVTIAGCGGDGMGEAGANNTNDDGVTHFERELSIGSTGADVRALNQYFTRFGYFPNDSLAHDYPAWRPLVDEEPGDPNVFDEATAKAVREFQLRSGLSPSGVADLGTLTQVSLPRCGVPEGIARTDASDKFAFGGRGSYFGIVSWALVAGLPGPNPKYSFSQLRTALQQAFMVWRNSTGLEFNDRTGMSDASSAMVKVQFVPLGANVGGSTNLPNDGSTVSLNSTINWLPNTTGDLWATPASSQPDLPAVMVHEIGHALGLAHSSMLPAVMRGVAGNPPRRALAPDDMVSISVLSDTLVNTFPGTLTDVASGNILNYWKVDGGPPNANGDHGIFQLSGTTWVPANGAGTRITIDGFGQPWIVNTAGQVWRFSGTSANNGNWVRIDGVLGSDIGAGIQDAGFVWVIGKFPNANGDGTIFKFDSGGWHSVEGAARRVAVTPSGVPWVVNTAGNIFRRVDAQGKPTSSIIGSWQLMPGLAKDIAVSPDPRPGVNPANVEHDGFVWILGSLNVGGGNTNLFVWDEQPSGVGSPPAPQTAGWLQSTNGAGVTIGATSFGTPIFITNTGAARMPTR